MTGKLIHDLTNVEVEHMVATDHTGKVKLRAETAEAVAVGVMLPLDARDLACNLMIAAARAEYEQDFIAAAAVHNMPEEMVSTVLALVRQGEVIRRANLAQTTGPVPIIPPVDG